MESIRIKFEVMAIGDVTIHSNKNNRDYRRARLIGFALDEFGGRIPCTADLGFEGKLTITPKSGDVVLLTLSALSTRGAMAEMTFSECAQLPSKSKA